MVILLSEFNVKLKIFLQIFTFSMKVDQIALPRFSLMIALDSGKQVSFSEGGDRAGIPVIFLPGISGNRFWTAIYDEVARENGIRLITFDRPGRGGCEPMRKGWGFHSWAGMSI